MHQPAWTVTGTVQVEDASFGNLSDSCNDNVIETGFGSPLRQAASSYICSRVRVVVYDQMRR